MLAVGRIAELAHHCLSPLVEEGDVAVDATAGNGRDTLYLAGLVGPGGKVFAFDVQEDALAKTARLLAEHNLSSRVTLIHDGHENLSLHLPGMIRAVIYNLGYLPGGNTALTTMTESTVLSARKALNLLLPGGVLVMVLYPGHLEGRREKEALLNWGASLDGCDYAVVHTTIINRFSLPPELLVIQKCLLR